MHSGNFAFDGALRQTVMFSMSNNIFDSASFSNYPDIPCRDSSTSTVACVPFPADDPVRLFYAQHGMVFEERCVSCRRILVHLRAVDVLGCAR